MYRLCRAFRLSNAGPKNLLATDNVARMSYHMNYNNKIAVCRRVLYSIVTGEWQSHRSRSILGTYIYLY